MFDDIVSHNLLILQEKKFSIQGHKTCTHTREMVMKREELEAAERRSRYDRGIYNVDYELQKYFRFSSEHGCLIMDINGSFSSSTSTVGNAQIYTRDFISTIGSRNTKDVTPNLGENSPITNASKDWGTDLSL